MMIEVNKFLSDQNVLAVAAGDQVSVEMLVQGLGIDKARADNLMRNYYNQYQKNVQGVFVVAFVKDGRFVHKLVTEAGLRAIPEKLLEVYLIAVRNRKRVEAHPHQEVDYSIISFTDKKLFAPKEEEKPPAPTRPAEAPGKSAAVYGGKVPVNTINASMAHASKNTPSHSGGRQPHPHASTHAPQQQHHNPGGFTNGAVTAGFTAANNSTFVNGLKRNQHDSINEQCYKETAKPKPNQPAPVATVKNAWKSNFNPNFQQQAPNHPVHGNNQPQNPALAANKKSNLMSFFGAGK